MMMYIGECAWPGCRHDADKIFTKDHPHIEVRDKAYCYNHLELLHKQWIQQSKLPLGTIG